MFHNKQALSDVVKFTPQEINKNGILQERMQKKRRSCGYFLNGKNCF